MPDINERKLVEQAQKEPQAFAVLYDRYVARIFKYVQRQVQDEMVAQDVTAVTFEKALRHIRRYEVQDGSFSAWLYRIAHNELMSYYRRQKFLSPLKWFGQTEGRGTETAVAQREQYSQLRQALHQLSAKDRDIIYLRYFEELASEEVAEILECSTQNVYLRLHRALKRLQQQLEKTECQVDWRLESNLPNSQ
jgi:RNA polymerase sigma-70 factor (ECF subfamily)